MATVTPLAFVRETGLVSEMEDGRSVRFVYSGEEGAVIGVGGIIPANL